MKENNDRSPQVISYVTIMLHHLLHPNIIQIFLIPIFCLSLILLKQQLFLIQLFLSGHPTEVEGIDLLILASQWAGVASIRQVRIVHVLFIYPMPITRRSKQTESNLFIGNFIHNCSITNLQHVRANLTITRMNIIT